MSARELARLAVMFGFIAAVNLAGWGIFVWYVMPHHVDYRGVGGGGLGVGLFVVVWAAALLYWRLGNVEARWTSGTVVPRSRTGE